ncbi:glycosyltransferase [Rhodanobacter sp. BL-MT-08]
MISPSDPGHSKASTDGPGKARLAVVTVTFHPDLRKLATQLSALPVDAISCVVDNRSDDNEVEGIRRIVAARPNTFLLESSENLGLAAATNKGAALAAEHVGSQGLLLLMDQDSEPQTGAIDCLVSALLHAERHRRVGCVGPQLVDETTGLHHGFHAIRGWRWVRVFPNSESKALVRCANLNGSGTLMRMSLYQALGGLDERLFIDHVDTDWAFRVSAAGYELLGIPPALFKHSMGERGIRFWWFGWHVWPQRSPQRHYYLFRNGCYLLSRTYVPRVWKFWAVVKLSLTVLVYLAFDPRRKSHMHNVATGVRDAGKLKARR